MICSDCRREKIDGKYKTCDKCRSSNKQSYQVNKEKKKKYYEDNKEAITALQKKYRENNKEIIAEKKKQYYREKKDAAYEILGGYVCKHCGNRNKPVLCIDHINGCGGKNRVSSIILYKDVVINPHLYQVLCENCNWIKRHAECKVEYKNNSYYKRKNKAYEILGGYICKWCGDTDPRVLHIDHINGCGNKNRLHSVLLYKQVIARVGNGFQVLCANCNRRKKHNHDELLCKNTIPLDVKTCCSGY